MLYAISCFTNTPSTALDRVAIGSARRRGDSPDAISKQLTYETGVAIDNLAVVGGGSTRVREELARRACRSRG